MGVTAGNLGKLVDSVDPFLDLGCQQFVLGCITANDASNVPGVHRCTGNQSVPGCDGLGPSVSLGRQQCSSLAQKIAASRPYALQQQQPSWRVTSSANQCCLTSGSALKGVVFALVPQVHPLRRPFPNVLCPRRPLRCLQYPCREHQETLEISRVLFVRSERIPELGSPRTDAPFFHWRQNSVEKDATLDAVAEAEVETATVFLYCRRKPGPHLGR